MTYDELLELDQLASDLRRLFDRMDEKLESLQAEINWKLVDATEEERTSKQPSEPSGVLPPHPIASSAS